MLKLAIFKWSMEKSFDKSYSIPSGPQSISLMTIDISVLVAVIKESFNWKRITLNRFKNMLGAIFNFRKSEWTTRCEAVYIIFNKYGPIFNVSKTYFDSEEFWLSQSYFLCITLSLIEQSFHQYKYGYLLVYYCSLIMKPQQPK